MNSLRLPQLPRKVLRPVDIPLLPALVEAGEILYVDFHMDYFPDPEDYRRHLQDCIPLQATVDFDLRKRVANLFTATRLFPGSTAFAIALAEQLEANGVVVPLDIKLDRNQFADQVILLIGTVLPPFTPRPVHYLNGSIMVCGQTEGV